MFILHKPLIQKTFKGKQKLHSTKTKIPTTKISSCLSSLFISYLLAKHCLFPHSNLKKMRMYSRVHISSDKAFCKILKKPSIVQKENIPQMKAKVFFVRKKQKRKKKIVLFFINGKTKGFHMRQLFFLHYGQFLQNLAKGFIRTNMHTTV